MTQATSVCLWPGCDRTNVFARGLCQRCNMRARRAGTLHEFDAPLRVCGVCGAEFATGTRAGNTYCSEACRFLGIKQRREAERNARLADRKCARCGAGVPLQARDDARFCSVVCQQAGWYEENDERLRAAASMWRLNNSVRVNEAHHRRRARLLGQPVERIDRAAVWIRDEGKCWLCEQGIDPSLRAPHPFSASLDHIVPISRGGAHVMSNLAMSHLRCNISKKDRLLDRRPRWATEEVVHGALDAESA